MADGHGETRFKKKEIVAENRNDRREEGWSQPEHKPADQHAGQEDHRQIGARRRSVQKRRHAPSSADQSGCGGISKPASRRLGRFCRRLCSLRLRGAVGHKMDGRAARLLQEGMRQRAPYEQPPKPLAGLSHHDLGDVIAPCELNGRPRKVVAGEDDA